MLGLRVPACAAGQILSGLLVASAAQAQTSGSWYYCDPAQAYYPYVNTCPVPWRAVAPHAYGHGQAVAPEPPAAPQTAGALPGLPQACYGACNTFPSGQPSPAYRQGQADRQAWETWFGTLTGDYRAGADWWSGQRSLPHPGSCSAAPPSAGADWMAGCIAAQERLAPSDVRRRMEPDYRLGWNNPPPVAPSPAPANLARSPESTAGPVAPAPAPENSSETLGATSPPPSASPELGTSAAIEPGAGHPLPPGFKLHNDSRSLCQQISDDFIVEAAAGRIEDNNPAPRGSPRQRDVNGGFVKFFLKGVIDRIDGVTFVSGNMYPDSLGYLAGGTVVMIECKGTLVMHETNARISGSIIFFETIGSRVPRFNTSSFAWGADSIYNNDKFAEPPLREEWGTPSDWGYPDGNTPPPPLGASCKEDWRRCKDNSDVANNFAGYSQIRDACQTAANEKAPYGTPIWPGFWSGGAFGSFNSGDGSIRTGEAILIEPDAQFQNEFSAMVHTSVVCVYDLKAKIVVRVNILGHRLR
jgi:hypothetical protein